MTVLKTTLKIFIGLVLANSSLHATNIELGQSIFEDFDGIGTSATASLPTGWKVDKSTSVRKVGTFAAAAQVTEEHCGNDMAHNASNGIYNYGAGVAGSASDRAVGFISSRSATKSGNLYVRLFNSGAEAIESLIISYDVEKYRKGSNAEGFSIQLYYSVDGSSWMSAGAEFASSFTKDSVNEGYASAPGDVKSVIAQTLAVGIPVGQSLYLAWNYSVTSSSTTSNAQGLGVDNVEITAGGQQVELPTNLRSTEVTAHGFNAAWDPVTGADGYQISLWIIRYGQDGEEFESVQGWESTPVQGNSAAITGLQPKTTYYWQVCAVADQQAGDPSDYAEVTTLADSVDIIDPPEIAALRPLAGGGVEVEVVSRTGVTYELQWRADLMTIEPGWQTVAGSARQGDGQIIVLTDSTARGASGFYRVRAAQ